MEFKPMMKDRSRVGALVLLLGLGLLANGCESDATAPHDPVPPLSELEVAQQAGRVAFGIAKVGPELLNFNGKKSSPTDVGVYPYVFPAGGDISGSIILEYFTGGATGTPSAWDVADYGHLYTPGSTMLTAAIDVGGLEVRGVGLAFDIQGDSDRTADTATVFGAGTIVSGSWSNDFTITESDPVVLSGVSAYPQGGTLMFTFDSSSMLVEFDGDHTAGVTIGGILSYMIDLDTGLVTVI